MMRAELRSLAFQGDDALVEVLLAGFECEDCEPCNDCDLRDGRKSCDGGNSGQGKEPGGQPNLIALHKHSGKKVEVAPEFVRASVATYRLGLGKAGNLAPFNDANLHFFVEGLPVNRLDSEKAPLAQESSWSAQAGLFSAQVPVTRGVFPERMVGSADIAHHSNEFFFTKDEGELCLKIVPTWEAFEDTEEKRSRIRRRLYPLMRHLPLKKNKVLFESFSKRTFSDNPKAIYEELVARDLGYECVWSLSNEKTDVGPRGKTVRYGTLKYWYHVATAKYLVSNYNQYRIVKRPDQIMVNTMHGVPLKHMGLSVAKKDATKANMRRLFDFWDYFVTPCDFLSDILRSDHFGFKGTFIRAGYPRNDVLLREYDDAERIAKVRESLGVPQGKKVILWAPTWRTKKHFDLKLDLAAMKEALSDEYVLVLRSHYLESQFVPDDIYDDFVLNGHAYENVNEMLYAADALITDYSSIMFDYSLMQRPMVIFAWDYDSYMGKNRGIYFDIRSEYPGLMAETTDQVIDRFCHLDEVMEEVARFHDRFNQYDQGDASAKVVDALWGKKA